MTASDWATDIAIAFAAANFGLVIIMFWDL